MTRDKINRLFIFDGNACHAKSKGFRNVAETYKRSVEKSVSD